jgi:hypothetical protein
MLKEGEKKCTSFFSPLKIWRMLLDPEADGMLSYFLRRLDNESLSFFIAMTRWYPMSKTLFAFLSTILFPLLFFFCNLSSFIVSMISYTTSSRSSLYKRCVSTVLRAVATNCDEAKISPEWVSKTDLQKSNIICDIVSFLGIGNYDSLVLVISDSASPF